LCSRWAGCATRSDRHGELQKNILIGTGGRDSINRSYYLGAVYGMERIMGRVRTILCAAFSTRRLFSRQNRKGSVAVVAHSASVNRKAAYGAAWV